MSGRRINSGLQVGSSAPARGGTRPQDRNAMKVRPRPAAEGRRLEGVEKVLTRLPVSRSYRTTPAGLARTIPQSGDDRGRGLR